VNAESGRMLFIDFVEKVRDEHGDVIAAIAEGREAQIHDVEAIVEVLAEGALFDHGEKVAIGSGEDARFDGNAVGCANGPDFALLQGSQEFCLQVEGEFANLIEEDGSAAGGDQETILGKIG